MKPAKESRESEPMLALRWIDKLYTPHSLGKLLASHIRTAALCAGILLVALWTLARFISQPATFDLYGQQGLVHQWLQGFHEHALIGITHYLPKMILLYAPLDMLPGDPRLKLILLTLGVNILTFVAIFIVLEKILKLFSFKPAIPFYAAMVWFASLSGSIYWIQFTNSRNLEVVGGVWLLYLSLKYWLQPERRLLMGIGILATVALFSDTLQAYMTLLPLLAFLLWCRLHGKGSWKTLGILSSVLAGGLVLSKGLLIAAQALLPIEFLQPSGKGLLGEPANVLPSAAVGVVKWFAVLFYGGVEFSRSHQILNVALVCIILGLAFVAWFRIARSRVILGLCLTVIAVNIVVYFLSGQSLIEGTSRYLIMTAPMVVLVAALLGAVLSSHIRRPIVAALLMLSILNGIAVVSMLVHTTGRAFPSDAHLHAVHIYLQKHHYRYAYTSMDTAVPAAYLQDNQPTLLPLSCEPGALKAAYLFYDRAISRKATLGPNTMVPLILDGDRIANYPAACSKANAIEQFGQPTQTDITSDGSQVLLYDSRVFTSISSSL